MFSVSEHNEKKTRWTEQWNTDILWLVSSLVEAKLYILWATRGASSCEINYDIKNWSFWFSWNTIFLLVWAKICHSGLRTHTGPAKRPQNQCKSTSPHVTSDSFGHTCTESNITAEQLNNLRNHFRRHVIIRTARQNRCRRNRIRWNNLPKYWCRTFRILCSLPIFVFALQSHTTFPCVHRSRRGEYFFFSAFLNFAAPAEY